MEYDLVDTLTVTVKAYEPTYIFQIELSDIAMEQLKYKSLLCGLIRFPKHESKFLSDLADMLCAEVLQKLIKMSEVQKTE